MAAGDGLSDSDVVDRVINQVLEAERQAREAVEQCRKEAGRIVADAQEGARSIERRTEDRIRLTHKLADRAVERSLGKLRAPRPGSGSAVPEGEARDLVDRAVDALVDEILDGSP